MAMTVSRNKLPAQLTSFIGREAELCAVAELLANPACRLLTLVGAGGIGKTRLAIEVAFRVAQHFADGVCFIPLQAVPSPDLLTPAIVDALAIPRSGQADLLSHVLTYLHDKHLLLVLDNVEHLLDAIGVLTAILQAAPAVTLLVTSREVLHLQEEWLYRIDGLAVPADAHADAWANCDAVRLFVERARQVRHDLALETEAAAVVRICRLVEGMPLALEVAAAWLSTLSCAEVADEIQRSLDFLSTTLRDVPERHRSMRAVFDHSWQRLSPEERAVFMRLSVFRGGFNRAAAEVVAGATLPLLTALVGKSLLRWEFDRRRYQIHGLLRQYAAEQLAQSPPQVIQAHDAHCSSMRSIGECARWRTSAFSRGSR